MDLNIEIIKAMPTTYTERMSAYRIAELTGDEPREALAQLEALLKYRYVVRWSDGTFSLSKSGTLLKRALTLPIPLDGRPSL